MRHFLHVYVKLSKACSWNLSESTLVYKLIGDNSLHSSARTSEHRHSNELTRLVVYRSLFFIDVDNRVREKDLSRKTVSGNRNL